jgi:hypothetical protein
MLTDPVNAPLGPPGVAAVVDGVLEALKLPDSVRVTPEGARRTARNIGCEVEDA